LFSDALIGLPHSAIGLPLQRDGHLRKRSGGSNSALAKFARLYLGDACYQAQVIILATPRIALLLPQANVAVILRLRVRSCACALSK
jgi:hypothetical protein